MDMNLPPAWAPALQAEGFDAIHWSSVGKPTAADDAIMKFASDGDYTVLTHDLDFGAILAATGETRPSVIQIRAFDIRPHHVGRAVVRAIRQMTSELERGALMTIDAERSRVRILPIR